MTAHPDALDEAVRGDKALAETLGRMEQHLGVNGVDMTQTPATLGAHLTMDPKTEQFPGNKDANAMLTATYREPFVVREQV